jgi:hypothetical protein
LPSTAAVEAVFMVAAEVAFTAVEVADSMAEAEVVAPAAEMALTSAVEAGFEVGRMRHPLPVTVVRVPQLRLLSGQVVSF